MAQTSRTVWKATALPPPEEAKSLPDVPNALSAYKVCLEFECRTEERIKAGAESSKSQVADLQLMLIHARILGYLLLFAPSHLALAQLVTQIHSCNNKGDKYDNLNELGKSFLYFFIVPFKKFKGNKTPATSEHPSRPSFDRDRKALMGNLKEAPKDHKQAKERALYRDGYRCRITGMYDMLALQLDIDTEDEINAAGAVNTECAHIIPESTFFNITANQEKAAYAATVLTVLERFGFPTKRLNGEKIHSLFNVITMEKNVHDFFDRLDLWLEKTDITNQYRPDSSAKVIRIRLPHVIKFTSTDPEHLQVPSPELLALHATCAKVAHMSGAAEYINKFDRDLDYLDVLASDGTSAAVLDHVIWEKLGNSVDVGA